MVTVFSTPQRGDEVQAEHITDLETAVNALEQNGIMAPTTTATPAASGGPIKILTTGSVVESADITNRKSLLALFGTNRTEADVGLLSIDQLVTNLSVGSVTVTAGGSGYTSTPTVTFSAPEEPGGVTATALVDRTGTVVTSIYNLNGGSGYRTAPTVTISGGGGTGATATATLQFMARSGIVSRSFTPEDTGGESSAIIGISTGASCAITAYRVPHMRPAGMHDYSASARQGPALEVGTTGQWYAQVTFAPSHDQVVPNAGVLLGLLEQPTSKGILIDPRLTFDGRIAYAVGTAQPNAPDINLKFGVRCDGTTFSTNVQDGYRGTVDAAGYALNFRKSRDAGPCLANDIMGNVAFYLTNSASAEVEVVRVAGAVSDPTAGSEDGQLIIYAALNGVLGERLRVQPGGVTIGAGSGNIKQYLFGQVGYDPPSLAAGASVSTTVTVTGAVVGNLAMASFSGITTAGWIVAAYVTAADTVTITIRNETGGVVDLPSATIRCGVFSN